MTPNFEFATLANPEQTQQLGTILSQCFNSPLSEWSVYLNRIGVENFRVLRQGGQVAGGLAVIEMGQWFGGCSVPMAGVAAVGIPPEYRGMGAAVELLSLTLKEIQAKQVPISVLYPATQYLYRQVGYEQGGTAGGFEMRLDGLRLSVNREIRAIPMHSVTPIRHEFFHDIYRQWAVQNNGNLDRNSAIWQSIIQPREQETIYAYLVGSQNQPQGYIIFKQDAKESEIVILDWVALSAAAAQRLWMFLADHRSQIQKVFWRGAALNPFLLLLPEQTTKVRYLDRWMLRIIDVPKALEIRGYPVGVETELHLAIIDELLPENNGNFILSVSGGRGEVTRRGKGELHLNIRGLAPLYTGLYTPSQLQVSGYLEATDNAVLAATQIFAGAEPWMPDFF
jgi:predicted acetyltransferase